MKKINYLLLMVLLSIPFLGARADWDANSKTLTYDVNRTDGQIYLSYTSWGQSSWWDNAETIILTCSNGGYIRNDDAYVLQKIARAGNLKILNMTGVTFTTDLTISSCPASTDETGWNVYGDDEHTWPDVIKGTTSTRHFGKYKNGWGSVIYGYCMANELGAGMFANSPNLQKVYLPTSITTIGTGSFYNCPNLQSVDVPANIVKFGWECFAGDSKLQNLTPSSGATDFSNVTCVNSAAFKDCTSLPSSTFKKFTNASTIGYQAFQNTKIELDAALQIITNFHYGNVSSSNGDYNKLPYAVFADCPEIKGTIDLTKNPGGYIQGIGDEAFENCTGMTGVKINSEVTSLGNKAFSGCTSLAIVEVNSATAPTCGTDVFKGVVPNTCEVVFATTGADAYNATGATGYMSYRVHQNDNDFKYLLTKTMDEDNTDYKVVPQRHADVVLHRTFKAGWNTLALPFGSASDTNKPTDCAEIYQNALKGKGTTGTSDFMIAGYRGFNTVTKTFYFLKNEDVANIPLNEFEPLLIKMGEGDIASSENKYTFENVEVNYDLGGSSRYDASTVKQLIGKMSGSTQYDNSLNVHYDNGNYDSGLNKKLTNLDYGTYFFTGTLYKQTCTAAASASIENFIQAGDYIIQDNNFYKVAAGSNYGLKGFRGWFKQLKPSASGAKSSVFSIDVENNGGETTDIVKIDANGEEVKDMNNVKVYNINGQFVGTSLNGLSKGLYIVNGKKYVVK
jgi:hypothetical protein